MSQPSGLETLTIARVPLHHMPADRVINALAELLDDAATAITTFERSDGGWELELYFCSRPDESTVRALLGGLLGSQAARAVTFGTLTGKDWVAASLASLAPVAAGRFVLHGSHDRGRAPSNRITIEIAAALAFGTGHHGTTRGCLIALDHLLKSQRLRAVLDVGTGTGVIAIAAAKSLRRRVAAGDIDPRAVATARANASRNGVQSWVEVAHAAGIKSARLRAQAPFDLVCANILLEPLTRLAQPIAAVLARGARAILSGLLPSQANAALAAYRRCGLVLERRLMFEGWVTLVLARRQRPRVQQGWCPAASRWARSRGASC